MKKLSTFLLMTTLMGCVSHPTEMPVSKNNLEEYSLKQEYEVIPVQNIVTQPDEEIQALQDIETPSLTQSNSDKDGAYVDWLTKKLRKELRSSGILVKEVSGQIDLIIPNKVAFGNNQMKFQTKFEEAMLSVSKLLKEYDETMIQIIGYTNEAGSFLANKEASLKKADILAGYLRNQGISSDRIITDGAGTDNPIGNNETAMGRELNRRIEMTIISLK